METDFDTDKIRNEIKDTETITAVGDLVSKVNSLFLQEPNFQELPSDKPIIFVGDLHGDIENAVRIVRKYSKDHRIVFLGDYIDRSTEYLGSLKNISYLLKKKIENPKEIIMLRGNHEFNQIYNMYGFGDELREIDHAFSKDFLWKFTLLFPNMPYIVTTDNGIIGLHGGIPNVESVEEIKNLPKGVTDYNQHPIISQIVWNDNIGDCDNFFDNKGYTYSNRGLSLNLGILYGEPYFSEKMSLLGKKVLVRGHNQNLKGYSLNNKVLTVFSSRRYTNYGNLKGAYVAILDPQKEINNALDLKIEFL